MSRIWAVTSYFNPAGYRTKLANYRTFRQHLRAPLAAIELSYSGSFELTRDDADLLIRVSGGDVMWQKERLLNIALTRLPGDCRFAAWVDCDVVFSDENWLAAAERELERATVCQLFHIVHYLPRKAAIRFPMPENGFPKRESAGYAHRNGIAFRRITTEITKGEYTPGHAWAARMDLLRRHGLYDPGILGGGDSLMACAMAGLIDAGAYCGVLSPAHEAHYREWAGAFHKDVGMLSCLPGEVFHLWHGELEDRKYMERRSILTAQNFDPSMDIALGRSHCWQWNSPKPELHRRVRDYFLERNEDGILQAYG